MKLAILSFFWQKNSQVHGPWLSRKPLLTDNFFRRFPNYIFAKKVPQSLDFLQGIEREFTIRARVIKSRIFLVRLVVKPTDDP